MTAPAVARMDHWRLTAGSPGVEIPASALSAPPELSLRARYDWADGPVARLGGALEAEVAAAHPAAAALMLRWTAEGGPMPVRVDRAPGPGGEWSTVWRGWLTRFERRGAVLGLRGTTGIPGEGVELCRDAASLPGFEGLAPGSWIAQVFGECPGVRPVFLSGEGSRALLAKALAIDADELLLAAPVDWSAPGSVQVNDEPIGFAWVSADGLRLGSAAQPLTRPDAREHPARSEARLVPSGGYAWAVCDHAAEVSEVETGSDDEPRAVTTLAASVEELAGREATLLRGGALPLDWSLSPTPALRVPPIRYTGNWSLTQSTNAAFPAAGFDEEPGFVGAVLSLPNPVLEADWVLDLTRRGWRFDDIRAAWLAFDFHPMPGAPEQTELRATVARGADTVQSVIGYDGIVPGLKSLAPADTTPFPFMPLRIDVSELLGGPRDWAMFAGPPEALRVRFEFAGGILESPIILRRIRWEIETNPAGVPRGSTALRARVRGRHAGDDGRASVGDSLSTLLGAPEFAALEPEALDAPGIALAGSLADSRGTRIRAAVQRRADTADAIARLCGEAGLLLTQSAEGWSARALPALGHGETEAEFGPAQAGPAIREAAAFPPPLAAMPRVWTPPTPADEARIAENGAGRTALTWIGAGIDAARAVGARWGTTPVRIEERAAAAAPPPAPPGATIAYGHAARAHIAGWRSGRAGVVVEAVADAVDALAAVGSWSIAHNAAQGRIAFSHNGIVVAELNARGSLTVAGTVRQETVQPDPGEIWSEDGLGRLVASVGTGASRIAFALAAHGDLHASGLSAGLPQESLEAPLLALENSIAWAPGGVLAMRFGPENGLETAFGVEKRA